MIVFVLKLQSEKYWIERSLKLYDIRGAEVNKNTPLDDIAIPIIDESWVHLYKPIRVVEILFNADKFDEIKLLLKYMDKYGISEVRGASFTKIHLKPAQEKFLLKEINHTNRIFKVDFEDELEDVDLSPQTIRLNFGNCTYCHKRNCFPRYCLLRNPYELEIDY